ncbi:monovalent cation/H+ antiporter complex subunit F [uncultured Serinicoccus sp.]|uniref:monovalent cation/H+ antiporter complex subunit F n=1 Tax=uncultured Serinicoccus sp. TaxID=735514 RepID=UPI00260F7F7F|nr:monovalent cation/H+ antiporter complex subunit F [uncultured Serinicoccus sp.]
MTIDLVELVLTWIVGGLLAVSATLTLIRITIGPSVLDRVVATDVLVSIVICALGAYAALSDAWTTLPLLISLSLVGFLGSVAVARFVARDRDTPAPEPVPDRLEVGERDAGPQAPAGGRRTPEGEGSV